MDERPPFKKCGLAYGGPSESRGWGSCCTISFKRVSSTNDSGDGESRFLALPYRWPPGERVQVILTPVGPWGERV